MRSLFILYRSIRREMCRARAASVPTPSVRQSASLIARRSSSLITLGRFNPLAVNSSLAPRLIRTLRFAAGTAHERPLSLPCIRVPWNEH